RSEIAARSRRRLSEWFAWIGAGIGLDIATSTLSSMADENTPDSLHAKAVAIAVAAREQVLAAARLEIEQLRRSLDAIEPDVADVVGQLCESVQADPPAPTDNAGLVLDQLALAVTALAQPTGGAQLLSTIADVFGEYFSRALVGAAEPEGFTVWHSRGFE